MNQLGYMIFLLILASSNGEDSSITCTKSFCENYPPPNSGAPACPTLPTLCNKTISDSGIFLPSPTPCNCCEFCIAYLNEGDTCSTGRETSDSPTEICGPGLYCDDDSKLCRKINETLCTNAQYKFDADKQDGKIGDYQVRPNCDGEGDYVPYHCIPGGICYCVSKNGTRIFGSIENNGKAEFDLPCTCSRNYLDMSIVMGRPLRPGEHFRCAPNGAYEPLQCIDDTTCFCVDILDGTPTFDNAIPVEIHALSNTTLTCFNKSVNTEGKFFRRCEELYMNKTKEIKDKNEDYDIILSYELPKCTPDGHYAPVQENKTHIFCMTPEGIPMEEYMLEKKPDSDAIKEMNCKCAMALRITTSSVEKPICQKNGNYNSTQYRRGSYYFVDEDGNQILENNTNTIIK